MKKYALSCSNPNINSNIQFESLSNLRLGSILGTGTYGMVRAASIGKQSYAVKIIPLSEESINFLTKADLPITSQLK